VAAAASAKLLAMGAAWRLTGVSAAGDALVAAVTTGGETERTLAGMLLVKAGDRSVPVVTDAIMAGPERAELVDVLLSIGTDDARAALLRVSQAPPPAVPPATRDAAAEALRTLDEIRRQDGGGRS
jgi:hypothetical protein